jgi:PKHD-type hydroxylase
MDGTFLLMNALKPQQLKALRETIAAHQFTDGQLTASGMAKSVKNNQQLTNKEAPELIKSLSQEIIAMKPLQRMVMPKALVRLMVSRYTAGMTYGTHTDAAVIDGRRSDVSFTLFLSDPETYVGGELALETPFGEEKIKLNAGSMVIYPTGVLHRVTPLESGERIAVVGWFESRIRDPQQRQMILDIDIARKAYLEKVGHDRNADLLLKTATNLRRLWDE